MFVKGKQALVECHLLVEIEDIDSVMSEDAKNMTILGQFSLKEDAEAVRSMVASSANHGSRLVIFSVNPHKKYACVDVVVIVSDEVN